MTKPVADPMSRAMRGRLGAAALYAKHSAVETTTPGRAAFLRRFEFEVDPEGKLPAEERATRAGHAVRAHMLRLAVASAKARRAKVAVAAPPPAPSTVAGTGADPERRISDLMAALGINRQRATDIVKKWLAEQGLPTGRGWVGERRVFLALLGLGLTTADFRQQFPLGPYKLDFAFPHLRLDVEVDGWAHTTASGAETDRQRDEALEGWGWAVVRVGADAPFGELCQRLRVFLEHHAILKPPGATAAI